MMPRLNSIVMLKVSQALDDIHKFVMERQAEDRLLVGFANVKQNPYREKSSCSIF